MRPIATHNERGGRRTSRLSPPSLRKVTRKERDQHTEEILKLLPNKPGKFEMLDKTKLLIDHDYQRETINQKRIEKIKTNFHYFLFGVLSVAARPDGKLYVWDGQHRLLGVKDLQDFRKVPCLVWDVDDQKAEAIAFLLAQRERTPHKSHDQFKTELLADDPLALALNDLLKRNRLKVSDGNVANSVACVERLKTLYQFDPQALSDALQIYTYHIKAKGALKEHLISALAYLAHQNGEAIRHSKIIERMEAYGEEALLLAILKKKKLVTHGAPHVYARAVAEAVNSGLRKENKLKVEEAHDEN